MKFAIENGLPYLISNGRAIPIEIKDRNIVIDESDASMTELEGVYTLEEIIAKCGKDVSSIPEKPKRRKKAEE